MKYGTAFFALLIGGAMAACSGDADTSSDTSNVEEASFDVYYELTRIDTRRCAWPYCGGYFVKAVNQDITVCPDGSEAEECYVAALNPTPELYKRVGDESWQRIYAGFESGGVVLRGGYDVIGDGIAWLMADDAHELAAGDASARPLHLARFSGVVCVTYPCPSTELTALNDGETIVTDISVDGLELDDAQWEQLFQQFHDTGIVIGGSEKVLDDIVGDVLLRADAVYLTAEQTALPPPPSECPPPTDSCMNESNHAQCLERSLQCPGEVLHQESCPAQFSCPIAAD